jgi:hypothetical protein
MLPVAVFTFHCAKLKGALYNLKMQLVHQKLQWFIARFQSSSKILL